MSTPAAAETPAPPSGPRRLTDLPPEIVERVVSELPALDVGAANATARFFRGVPGGRSPAEHALRARVRARGHERALPTVLPAGACTWTEELLARECIFELAHAHSHLVAASTANNGRLYFSAFVDAEGALHTCGEQALDDDEDEDEDELEYRQCAALGLSEQLDAPPVAMPTRVGSLSAVRVRSVAAGVAHLLALSDAGAVYACGGNSFGQLGHGLHHASRTFACVQALAPEVLVCVAAGGDRSAALSAAGCAFTWGGVVPAPAGGQHHRPSDELWEPVRVQAPDGVRFGGVGTSQLHTLLLSIAGDVYLCSSDGAADPEQRRHSASVARRVDMPPSVRAVHVSVGHAGGLVVGAEGGVYSLGPRHGRYGGRPGDLSLLRSNVLTGVHAVRACSSESDGSAVLGADGSVHTFGPNHDGRLGLGRASGVVAQPMRVSALDSSRVVDCALGGTHSLFLTADGIAHSCGQQTAALGHGACARDQRWLMRTPAMIEQLRCGPIPQAWAAGAPLALRTNRTAAIPRHVPGLSPTALPQRAMYRPTGARPLSPPATNNPQSSSRIGGLRTALSKQMLID